MPTLTEATEFDRAADEIVKELEELREAIPMMILVIRLAQMQAQRELREAEELALMGQQAESVAASARTRRR